MEADVNVAAHTERPKIIQFRFFTDQDQKVARVTMEVNGNQENAIIPLQAILDGATTTQKNTIRQFFKRIGVAGINKVYETTGAAIVEADLDGEIFDDV